MYEKLIFVYHMKRKLNTVYFYITECCKTNTVLINNKSIKHLEFGKYNMVKTNLPYKQNIKTTLYRSKHQVVNNLN